MLFAGLQTRRLPIIMIVLLGAWISYQTTEYLVGHLSELPAPVGSTSQNLGKNVSGRVAGSAEHTFIVKLRIVATARSGCWPDRAPPAAGRAGRVDLAF